MPCGRCRQLLWEHGGAECLVDTPTGIQPMSEVLPRPLALVILLGVDHESRSGGAADLSEDLTP